MVRWLRFSEGEAHGTARLHVRLAFVPLFAALLLVAACDDDDNGGETPTPSATTADATATTSTATGTATSPATATAPPGATTPAGATSTATTPPGSTDPVDVPGNAASQSAAALLTAVRIGAHPTFDRIVFEFADEVLPPAHIEYVASAEQCGSGAAVTVPGNAILEVRLDQTNAHNESGQTTAPREVPGTGAGGSIAGAINTCDFEAVVTYAVGTAGELPFTVSTLSGPSRLVIDVQHTGK